MSETTVQITREAMFDLCITFYSAGQRNPEGHPILMDKDKPALTAEKWIAAYVDGLFRKVEDG